MSLLCNLTGFGAVTLPSMGRDGRDLALAVTAARYRLPHPQDPPDKPLVLHDQQVDPPVADAYNGPPASSGLRVEGQAVYFRPATDITVAGHARAPRDNPVERLKVKVTVGPCVQEVLVTGDRVWETGLGLRMLKMSRPEPFVKMPLTWERAFGGSVFDDKGTLVENEPRNPVGCGLFSSRDQAHGKLVANIEDPANPISGSEDRPNPVGFGPVARWWQPRVKYAGTYDDAWVKNRAPVWPADFDERFFCAAPPALQATPHLQGGEAGSLEGLNPEGPPRFQLPTQHMRVRFRFNAKDVRTPMTLDAVMIDPDAGSLTLIHRAAAPALPNLATHRETIIRHIQPWEPQLR